MSTATRTPAETRYVVQGVGWKAYDALCEALADRPVRMTYDRGDIEFMSPLAEHERLAVLLRILVEVASEEFDVEYLSLRMTTFRREDLDRGLEPDDCFYIARWRAIVGKDRLDLTVDPAPDLAIEVDITSSSLDRLGIYAALGVPEVWRCDASDLRVLLLQPDGSYGAREQSPTFPGLPIGPIMSFIEQHQSAGLSDVGWCREFRAWLREQLDRAEPSR